LTVPACGAVTKVFSGEREVTTLTDLSWSPGPQPRLTLIRTLEREGSLNRELEFLPSEEQISELALAQKGLTRPELAVVMAHAKLSLKAILLNGSVIDEPSLSAELAGRFPTEETGFGALPDDVVAVAGNFRQAFGQHFILTVGGFVGSAGGGEVPYGARAEMLYTF